MHSIACYLYTYYNIEKPELCNWKFLEKTYFNYLECIYDTWYEYNDKLIIRIRTMVVRRKQIIQTTGFGAYSSTCF